MIVNQIKRMIPTLKVNNRNLNELFYIETLGMKPLLEESAFLSLGDQSGIEKLVLEESPSMRSRKVEGIKKLARLLVKVEKPSEIEALLARMEKRPRLYKGNKGYAFEVLSPEGDCVLIHAEDDIKDLNKVEEEVTFSKDEKLRYLTAFEISVEINLPEKTASLLEKEEIENRLAFNQAQGSDLLVENNTEKFDQLLDGTTDVAVYGHVHKQLLRYGSQGQQIINPGSIGMPYFNWKGLKNHRAQYALLEVENGELVNIQFRKVAYDYEAELESAKTKDLPFIEMYEELRREDNYQGHNRDLLASLIEKHGYVEDVKNYFDFL